ncbi:protein sneaky [Pectinophora gossypiella]|uniref:protein sneaky n=1 Tax=Pectinophora gossypiella TaxID=13191 RepID=UPI00214E458D|nr:protein sneaky [Pectinophora gossypiella]
MGQLYNDYLLDQIPFPHYLGIIQSIALSLILAIGNASCRQLRCISMLAIPMYCGKPGRGVLKAVVLTYVIAGPITNLGLNAREVVRVFSCSTQLSYNLSMAKFALMEAPFQSAIVSMKDDIVPVKDAFRSIAVVAAPIEAEMLDMRELRTSREVNDYIDDMFANVHRSDAIEKKYKTHPNDSKEQKFRKNYMKKLEYRCNDQLTIAVAVCMNAFRAAFDHCSYVIPRYAAWTLCWPMKLTYICNILYIIAGPSVCDSSKEVDPGLGEGFLYLEKAKRELTKSFKDVQLQYKVNEVHELADIQDAKETGDRVMHAFEEKHIIMQHVIIAVNVCVALLFIRILVSAGTYHDRYLTRIDHDNVYITSYFKRIDLKRHLKNKFRLLPLKKMERSRYVDVHSLAYTAERNKIVTQVLKVMLEMVTATTFVMLDRLFYEALDVVRQHAEVQVTQHGDHDLEIQVEGKGLLAGAVRMILAGLNTHRRVRRSVTNAACLPHPRSMPTTYFLKIYGGYLWILLLLYINPYTLRLRRLVCSWFYPRREKQRVLHLYNDILKKRVKIQKTVRRKAVQAIRAHYLSGENLLSLRIKFPQVLGWLRVFPAARMTCLICGQTQPRNASQKGWHSCMLTKCPFVYCEECWPEVGRLCLACDPSLAELSDVDSLSEDDQVRY